MGILTIPLLLGSCTASFFVIVKLNEDIPYREDNKPSVFMVLKKDDGGKWELVVLEGAGTYRGDGERIRNVPVIDWPEGEAVDRFFVEPEDMERMENKLEADRQIPAESGFSKLLRFDIVTPAGSTEQQEIAIRVMWGEQSYNYRYAVDRAGGSLSPVAHGSFVKRHLALATIIAFLITTMAWIMALAVAVVGFVRRRTERLRVAT